MTSKPRALAQFYKALFSAFLVVVMLEVGWLPYKHTQDVENSARHRTNQDFE